MSESSKILPGVTGRQKKREGIEETGDRGIGSSHQRIGNSHQGNLGNGDRAATFGESSEDSQEIQNLI